MLFRSVSQSRYALVGNEHYGEYELSSIANSYQIFKRVSGDLLSIGELVSMIKYVKTKDSYTLCFSEKNSTFTQFQSFIPSIYIKGYREFYTAEYSKKLYIHNIGNPMEFYGIRYPMILDFVVNGNSKDNKILGAFEFNTKVTESGIGVNGEFDWQGIENESISEINVQSGNRVTEFVPLVMKGGKLKIKDGAEDIDSSVYLSALTQLRDTSGIRIVPYPTYLFNIDNDHNKFRTTAPRVKVGRLDSDGRQITENIRGTYFIVRTVFNNNGIKRIAVHDITSYFETSIHL